ncbi:hypothetical protein RA27_02145 [Ruegeria sp. ANG-R]|nr:hypothetical protein RA27_02145 [Ruegeria sp. ANG-R]
MNAATQTRVTACETGETAGGLASTAPGIFSRHISQRSNLPNAVWNVTVRMPDGSIDTKVVEIDGGNLQADTDTLCRIALAEQHCVEAKEVLRITLGRTPHPHKLRKLHRILSAFRSGQR